MDYLTCPICTEAPLMKNGAVRKCVNCGHELNEIDYHMFAAQQMDKMNRDQDALARKVMRSSRHTFGRKQSSKKLSDVTT